MADVIAQASSLLLLGAVIWLGYRRWVAPHGALAPQQRGILLLTLLTFAGGLVGAPFWWFDEPRAFAWDLPPLAGRMLAAAGVAFAAVCVLALRRPSAAQLRLVALMLCAYLVPLAAAIPLAHRDRFDPAAPITYAFFAIVAVMAGAALWYLWRPAGIIPAANEAPRPLTRAYLAGVALLAGAWGAALWLTDNGPSPLIWVWPGDLLTSRLIAVMLATLAASAIYGMGRRDLARSALALQLAYGLGVALANGWAALAGAPPKFSYLIAFGLLALSAGGLLAADRGGPLALPAAGS